MKGKEISRNGIPSSAMVIGVFCCSFCSQHSERLHLCDSGETVAAGAKAVLTAVRSGLGSDGDAVKVLKSLTTIIDGNFYRVWCSFDYTLC